MLDIAAQYATLKRPGGRVRPTHPPLGTCRTRSTPPVKAIVARRTIQQLRKAVGGPQHPDEESTA
jgi:hypothetical protein